MRLGGEAWYRIVMIGGREVVQATGHADATITNVDNGRTITQNISGPTFSPTEVPAEYRKWVEEYYRSIGRSQKP